MADVQASPIALQIWITWLSVTAMAAVFWVHRHKAARAVFVAFLANLPLMMFAHDQVGMARLLGAVHFVFMAPAVYYAWRQLPSLENGTWHKRWLRVFGATWVISLWIDAADVIRWVAGER